MLSYPSTADNVSPATHIADGEVQPDWMNLLGQLPRSPGTVSFNPVSTKTGLAERDPSSSCLTAEIVHPLPARSSDARRDFEEDFKRRIRVSRPTTVTGQILHRVRQLYEIDCPKTGLRKFCNATTCLRCGPILWTKRAVWIGHRVAAARGQLVGKLPFSDSPTPSQVRTKMHRWQHLMSTTGFVGVTDDRHLRILNLQLCWVVERNLVDPGMMHVHFLASSDEPLIPSGIPSARRLAYLERRSAFAWGLPSAEVSALTPGAAHGLYYLDSVPGQQYQHQSTEEAAITIAVYHVKNFVLGTAEQIADHRSLNGRQVFNYTRQLLGTDISWESLGL